MLAGVHPPRRLFSWHWVSRVVRVITRPSWLGSLLLTWINFNIIIDEIVEILVRNQGKSDTNPNKVSSKSYPEISIISEATLQYTLCACDAESHMKIHWQIFPTNARRQCSGICWVLRFWFAYGSAGDLIQLANGHLEIMLRGSAL